MCFVIKNSAATGQSLYSADWLLKGSTVARKIKDQAAI